MRADSNKNVEHVKTSYTAPFDVLTFEIFTRETVFHEVVGVEGGLNGINLGSWETDHLPLP